MEINKGLLFFDGAALTANTAKYGKILDLGFCGDFDYKNFLWNRLFVSCPAKASINDLTLRVFTCQNEYSSASTYAVGDLVIYNGSMYRCTTAISSAEAWTAGHWSETLTDSALCSVTIPATIIGKGGAIAVNAPKGLKRYVTLSITPGASAPDKATIGFTQDVDTDCIALGGGIDWTNYKSDTFGTALKGTPMQNVAEVIANGSTTNAEASALVANAMNAHVATTKTEAAAADWGNAHVLS